MIISEGRHGILNYKIEKNYESPIYRITCNPEIFLLSTSNFYEFINTQVPNYGKFEVEEFIAKMLLLSLAKGDITDLFNTSVSYNDYPYNCGTYTKDVIKESILQYCEVLSEDFNIVNLKYLGTKKI